jgi:chemotaxis protein MotB
MIGAFTRMMAPQAPASSSAATSRIWLITFTDMVMQLLAFFVLLFTMSKLDAVKYQDIVRSYVEALNPSFGEAGEPPAAHVVLPAAAPLQGDDLGYLASVLQASFARENVLSGIQFRLTTQYLTLALPAGGLFLPDGTLAEPVVRQLFDLGGVLNNLKNRIAVVGFDDPASGVAAAQTWNVALARAEAVAGALVTAGYGRSITVLGRGEALGEVQIMILPEAMEP